MSSTSALFIVQGSLDIHGQAVIAGNIDKMMEFTDVPCMIDTASGRLEAETVEEMRAICEQFALTLRKMCLTHIVRRCLDAQFKDPETIHAFYETRYIQHGTQIFRDPYRTFMIAKLRPQGWKFNNIQLLVDGSDPVTAMMQEHVA